MFKPDSDIGDLDGSEIVLGVLSYRVAMAR